jgi:hypothetical protein
MNPELISARQSCSKAGMIALLISSEENAAFALRSATRFQPGGIGKLLWGPSLIELLHVRNIHKNA